MGANPNTQTLKEVWMDIYQVTHYKQPVFRVLADERLASKLKKGSTVHWSYKSDFYVEDMGADGSYNTQAQTDTDETLVINQVKDTAFYEFEKDLEQAHYNVKMEYAKKAMNRVFLQIDADVLYTAYSGAANSLDASAVGGTAGNPISISATNIPTVFAAAQTVLQLANVVYDPNLTFTKDVKLETAEGMPVAIISPQFNQALITFLGGKTTILGDKVSVSGHQGSFMSFNIFLSNQLTWTTTLTLAVNPTNGDKIVYNGLTFTFVTSATNAGEITIGGNAAATQATLKTAFNAPFTSVSGYVAQTDNVTNRLKMANASMSTFATNVATITQKGIGNATIVPTFTSASNLVGSQVQHNVFGISKSVAMVIQKYPELYVNPVSGKVGKDYVTWTYYGLKVFKYQTTQLIDVQVDSSAFTQPTLIAN